MIKNVGELVAEEEVELMYRKGTNFIQIIT